MGELVRIWDVKDNYMSCQDDKDNYVYFKSIKEHLDIAFLDLKSGILYINTKYKKNFRKAKADIRKDYNITFTSEYMDMV